MRVECKPFYLSAPTPKSFRERKAEWAPALMALEAPSSANVECVQEMER